MSEQLDKEMEELEELEEVTANAKTISATSPSSVKLKQEKEDMQKAKTSGATNTLKTKGDAKSVKTQGMEETELEGEMVEEPTLISSMEVHNKDTIEECFNYPGGSLKFLEEMEERERIYHAKL